MKNMKEFLYSKIHKATITDANIHYVGSITISKELLERAKLSEYQKVLIADINNGNRFETYIIKTDIPRTICVNGAAAKLVSTGDKIIIMAFELINNHDINEHKPIIINVDDNNKIM